MSKQSKAFAMEDAVPEKRGMPSMPKVNKKTMSRLLGYIVGKYKFRFVIVLICIFISAIAGVTGSLFIQTLIDEYITPMIGNSNPDFSALAFAIIRMACIYIVGIVSVYIYNRIMVTISQGVLKRVRDEMFNHMQTLPIKYFDTHSHGDIMSYYTNDTDTLREMISQSIPQMFASVITIVTVFIAMLKTNVILTVFVIATVTVMIYITKIIAGKSGRYFIRQQQSLAKVNGYIEEMVNGQKVVKVFNHEKAAEAEFDKINEELFENSNNANRFANILMPVLFNIGMLLYVLIAIFGGTLAINNIGGISIGVIGAFLSLSKSFTQPISQVSQQMNSIIMAFAGAERIFSLIDEQSEQDEGYVTLVNAEIKDGKITGTDKHTGKWAWKHPHGDGTVTYTELKGDIVFDDVDFGYEEDKIVLHNVSLYAEPGSKIAFVGATGAGKTTITNLINRFYDTQDGKIRYDGINISKIKKSDLRRSLGIVLQDVNLFTGTVMENIRYGKPDASDEEVYAASRLANSDDFIRRLPNGYDTMLTGNGSNLSQGQRQLISIARAAIADPPVMILDEATSSIDTRTESLVQKGMDGLMKGRTVFVIAHRLSTVQNSDVIMVLEHGRIIERGTHNDLINQKGKYYQLYTGAFELE